jgi:hypothetical protein
MVPDDLPAPEWFTSSHPIKINTGDGIEQMVKDSYESYFFLRAGNICCEIFILN